MWIIVLLLVLGKQPFCFFKFDFIYFWLNYHVVFSHNVQTYFISRTCQASRGNIPLVFCFMIYRSQTLNVFIERTWDWFILRPCLFSYMTQSCYYSQCKYDLTSRHVKRWGIVLQGETLVQLHTLPLSTSMWK